MRNATRATDYVHRNTRNALTITKRLERIEHNKTQNYNVKQISCIPVNCTSVEHPDEILKLNSYNIKNINYVIVFVLKFKCDYNF